jgi:pimeloyl-ACP methyl ester carboxylesterase
MMHGSHMTQELLLNNLKVNCKKSKQMKNRILLMAVVIAVFYSCSKDSETSITPERGTIIGNPVLMGNYSKTLIATTLETVAEDYAQNFNCNYDVVLYKIDYNTIDPAGNSTKASGLIIVPQDSTKLFPLLSWQHGTVLKKTNVPSHLQGDFQVGLVFATDGYIVACPDYLGMGDGSNLHPYLHAPSEATAVIDLLRATRLFCQNMGYLLNEQLFLAGYSQGGHVTMATLKTIEEQYSAEFTVTACSPMAGPYDLSETQLSFVMRDSAYPIPSILPYIIFAYNNVYQMYPDLSSVFLSQYYNEFKEYFNSSHAYEYDVVDDLWPPSKIPSVVLKSEIIESIMHDPDNPIVLALKENNLYDWAPKSPIHLCHCDADDIVSYQNSVVAYNSFVQHGSTNIKLVMPLHGGTHATCGIPSIVDAITWFDSLRQ